MFQKIKSKIKNFYSLKREGGAIFIPILIGVGIIAFYGLFKNLTNIDIFSAVISAVNAILVTVTGAFMALAASLLEWIISPGFIIVPFTKNAFVVDGWRVVRDFTNMFIVLGFVIVGIATALRIREYEAQKTLLPLILVALLINFTTVICGLIIDASNIVMDYFLKGGFLSEGFVNTLSMQLSMVTSAHDNPLEVLAIGSIFTFFNIMAFIIFLGFAFMFLARYVMLWLLVIVSPLAFFCYVFSFTKKYWSMWWNQFFQWCIIGIPAAFSLYLANKMMWLIYNEQLISSPGPSQTGAYMPLLGYFLPFVMLIVGFLFTLQSGAAGASIALGGLKKLGGGGKALVGKAGTAIRQSKLGTKVEGALGKAAERIPVVGVKPGTTAQRMTEEREKIAKRYKTAYATDPDTVRRASRRGGVEGAAAFYARAKAGDDKLTNEDYARYAPRALSMGFNKRDLERANPGMAYVLNNKKMDELRAANKTEAQARAQVTRDVVEKMTPAEIRKEVPISAYTPEVLAAMNPQQIEGTMGKGGTERQRHALRDFVSTPRGRAQIHGYGNQFAHGSLERENLARNIRQIRTSGRTPQAQPQTQTGTRGQTPTPPGPTGPTAPPTPPGWGPATPGGRIVIPGGGPTTPTPRPTPQRRPPRTTPGRPTP